MSAPAPGNAPASAGFRLALWQQIMIALALGLVTGQLLGEDAQYLKPIGDLFINAIMMLIVPLIFASLIQGITSMSDPAKMGRVGGKTAAIYMLTTVFAISLGMFAAWLFQPGAGTGMSFAAQGGEAAKEAPSLAQILIDLVPRNPLAAMAEGNILQIIVFSLILGISLSLIGDAAAPMVRGIDSLAQAMFKMTSLVMACAPIGVFALISYVSGRYGLEVLVPLAKIIGVVYVTCIFHVLVVYSGMVAVFTRLNPLRWLHGSIDALMVGFSTTSGAATLPVSLRCATKHLGVSKGVASFVLPVGATINMDGTAIYQGAVTLFIAQLIGVELTTMDYLMIVITGTLATIGTAGVPGAGLIMLSIILVQVGLPLEAVAVIAGIDRILDMARTTVNVAGDLMTSVVVGHSEGELDREVYDTPRIS
ncbi:dicarboxylate/amino acid:cation symporter [Halotalea alkalilenta]|uniref:dicarboxylate/amino acid:cation symporter n=1 Tax=Halotalea alkalilenta TaxID=376489 RepID=UPI00047F6726|nr:dicarboxylate/amino acid:cation symporter [Halotalea alkalilenta]